MKKEEKKKKKIKKEDLEKRGWKFIGFDPMGNLILGMDNKRIVLNSEEGEITRRYEKGNSFIN